MKKVIVLVLSCLLIVSCSEDKKTDMSVDRKTYKTGGIAKLLPENTVLMLKFSSIKRIYQSLSITGDSFFGEPNTWADNVKTMLGFNPYNLKDLKDQGLDITREIGVLFSELEFKENDEPTVTVLFFTPVTDGKKLLTTIKGLVEKNAPPSVKITKDGEITTIDGGGKNKQLYIVEKDGYLFFALSTQGNGKSMIQSVLSGKSSLTDSKSFKELAQHIDSSQDFFAFADVKKITSSNLDIIKKSLSDLNRLSPGVDMSKFLDYLKDYEGIGLNVDLKSSDLLANLVVNINPSSDLLKLYKNITYNKKTVLGISDPAALLISAGFNVSEYYKIILKTLESTIPVQDSIKDMNKEYDIDVEKDIIENIAGNFNLCTYDGKSLSQFNHNTIFTASIKDEGKMKEVINKIRKKLPQAYQKMFTEEKVGSVDAYVVNIIIFQIYIGLKDGNLIITSGKPMFEKAINGDPSKGFLTKLKDKSLMNSLGGKSESVFYVNVDEVFKALKNFGMLAQFGGSQSGKINDVVKQFKYILFSSKIIKNSATSHFVIKTNFNKPFLEGIKDIKDSLKQLGRLEQGSTESAAPQIGESVKPDDLKEAGRQPVKGKTEKLVPMKQLKKDIKN